MADRTLHRDPAAQAVTDDVRVWYLQIIEQPGHIVGEIFVSNIAVDVGGTPMALHFHGDYSPRFGKFIDPIIPVARDCHKCSVEEHDRFATSVDLVVHL